MIYKVKPGEQFRLRENGEYEIQVGDLDPIVIRVAVDSASFAFPEAADFLPDAEKIFFVDPEG